MRQTVLYLVRHGATEANLSYPPQLLGRWLNPLLAPLGVRQAEATRDALARFPLDCCYTSPLLRALETATLITQPHHLTPYPLQALAECNLGRWEGLSWEDIREREPEAYQQFMSDPARHGYPGGESFQDVHDRVAPAMERLLADHVGRSLLVVAHHVVLRVYLAGLLGLAPGQARRVKLDNSSISVVVRQGQHTSIRTLNDTTHLSTLTA